MNTQIIWIISMEILKNIFQINNSKYDKLLLITWLLTSLVIKKLNPIVTELFIIGRKLNISFIFITQSYFAVVKNVGLNSMQYLFYYENSK